MKEPIADLATVLVVGLGDPSDGDAGAGARAVEELRRRFDLPEYVKVLLADGVDQRLLEEAEEASFLLFVDCVVADEPPGSIWRVPLDEFERPGEPPESRHEREILEGLGVLEMLGSRPPAVLVAVQVGQRGAAGALSPMVAEALPALVERLAEDLVAIGVPLVPR